MVDPWLPVGYVLPDGAAVARVIREGADWQIFETRGDGHALVATEALARRWLAAGVVEAGALAPFAFGGATLAALSCGAGHALGSVDGIPSPRNKNEALAFADALRATRAIDRDSALHDAIYVERLTRLLPTYSLSARVPDDVVLGAWLTGGVPVSVNAFRRLRSLMGWMGEPHLREVLDHAGFTAGAAPEVSPAAEGARPAAAQAGRFVLAGRPELENFLNEHVVDIVTNRERYATLGVGFPAPIILHGPPGCGKTFAVERLVEFLGWPSFAIQASTVASPYIHETSRKVADVFNRAMQQAPSVLIIDEMEAFLADRERGGASSHHRVEEVAEFLRRIPEATGNDVLVIAMTNRIDMIDPAILRRGRFDHVVKVDMASEPEVRALLNTLVGELPHDRGVDVPALAARLAGRPLSDVTFVVREAARLAARAGKSAIDQTSLMQALGETPARDTPAASRKIGFL
jgi:cell division protease FtsH